MISRYNSVDPPESRFFWRTLYCDTILKFNKLSKIRWWVKNLTKNLQSDLLKTSRVIKWACETLISQWEKKMKYLKVNREGLLKTINLTFVNLLSFRVLGSSKITTAFHSWMNSNNSTHPAKGFGAIYFPRICVFYTRGCRQSDHDHVATTRSILRTVKNWELWTLIEIKRSLD